MSINFNYDRPKNEIVVAARERDILDALVRRTGNSGNRDEHVAMAATVVGPIRMVADYMEWASQFFQTTVLKPGEFLPRIAIHRPNAIALGTSTAGEVLFTRPGRKYATIEYSAFDTGVEIGWDDMVNAGWNVAAEASRDAAQALARKRDAMAAAILDAGIAAVSHNDTSSSVLTRASVDAVFKEAAGLGWKITRVVLNSGTAMDMSAWTSVANTLWQNSPSNGDQILQTGFVSNYGGAQWFTSPSVPAAKVYLAGSPADIAGYCWVAGSPRVATDVDIKKRIDLTTWDEQRGYFLGNPYATWSITIT